MGFQANVLKVMIASPGDVKAEREIITEGLYRWNDANAVSRELMLQPVKWETHSSPQMGAHPQDILNEHLLLDADIVVGIFGTRIGTATVNFPSGSVEEIKKHVAALKLAMLYFSHVPVDPNLVDPGQWSGLQAFKEECRAGGLYAEYDSHENLRTDFAQHLSIELNKPKYLWIPKPAATVEARDPELRDDETRLLIATATDRDGQILTGTTTGGFYVQTNDENFVEDTPRSAAAWKRVLARLSDMGYLLRYSEAIYELTEEGFARADKEASLMPLELSVSFAGTPDKQTLVVTSSKPVKIKQLDLLLSSGASVTSIKVEEELGSEFVIPIEHKDIIVLFNSPRPDMKAYDHAGPAALRVVFEISGRRKDVTLPITLQPTSVNGTQRIKLIGANQFTLA